MERYGSALFKWAYCSKKSSINWYCGANSTLAISTTATYATIGIQCWKKFKGLCDWCILYRQKHESTSLPALVNVSYSPRLSGPRAGNTELWHVAFWILQKICSVLKHLTCTHLCGDAFWEKSSDSVSRPTAGAGICVKMGINASGRELGYTEKMKAIKAKNKNSVCFSA